MIKIHVSREKSLCQRDMTGKLKLESIRAVSIKAQSEEFLFSSNP